MPRVALLVSIIAVFATVAGCLGEIPRDPPSRESGIVSYRILDATGATVGWMNFSVGTALIRMTDGDLRVSSSYEVAHHLIIPGKGFALDGLGYVDSASGMDRAVLEGCVRERGDLACQHGAATLQLGGPNGGASILLGSFLSSRFAGSRTSAEIRMQDGSLRSFSVRSDGRIARVQPAVAYLPRTAMTCNLIDDSVVIDLTRSLITECRREGETLVLESADIDRLPSASVDLLWVRGPVEPFRGPLPPGAEIRIGDAIALSEAYDAAMTSRSFSEWMTAHPTAVLHDAGARNGGSLEIGPARTQESSYRMRFLSGRDGYNLTVARSQSQVQGTPVPERWSVADEETWLSPIASHPPSLAGVNITSALSQLRSLDVPLDGLLWSDDGTALMAVLFFPNPCGQKSCAPGYFLWDSTTGKFRMAQLPDPKSTPWVRRLLFGVA